MEYTNTMSAFAKILKELMEEKSMDSKSLAEHIGLSGPSIIYRWLKDENGLLMSTAIKIANLFDCSLDYLFGRSDDYGKDCYKICPPFDEQFRKVLKEQNISQNKLMKNKIVSGGIIDGWLNKKQTPHIESIIKLADYLNVSMDYLTGREK